MSGSLALTTIDDDVAALGLTFASNSLAENGGTTTGRVTRNTPVSSAVVVTVTSDQNSLFVPATVTIPVGATFAIFNIVAINNPLADGTRLIGQTVSASGFVAGTAQLTVLDDEVAALSIGLVVSSIGEKSGATTGTVSRNTPTTDDLMVMLISSDVARATVPPSVLIPAGSVSCRLCDHDH